MERLKFESQLNKLGISKAMFWTLVNRGAYNLIPENHEVTTEDCQALLAGTFQAKQAPPSEVPQAHAATVSAPTNPNSPIIVQLPAPVAPAPRRKKREESAVQGVILALILIFFIGGYFTINYFRNSDSGFYLPDNFKSIFSGLVPEKVICEEGIGSSTHLELVNKPIQDKPLQQSKVTPTLKDSDSCIYFSGSEMSDMLQQEIVLQVKLKDGTTKEVPYTGLQIFAGKIAKATAIELGKDPDKNPDDKKWVDQTYAMLLPFLDIEKFKTIGEYQYLILPGYDFVPAETATATPTATPEPTQTPLPRFTKEVVIVPPTATVFVEPTALPTDTPLPTNIPRPTIEAFATEVNQALATAMDLYNLTPTMWPTSTDAHNAVSLEYYINNILNGQPACSPLSANYYTRWAMDDTVTLFRGIDCMDGVGPVYYVQIPAEIAARRKPSANFPQVWISKYPAPAHGPGLDIGNGYFIQPFQ